MPESICRVFHSRHEITGYKNEYKNKETKKKSRRSGHTYFGAYVTYEDAPLRNV
jgi:hypothetical protein